MSTFTFTFTLGSGPALEAAEFADFDTGQAVYRIAGVGAFTLGWDPDHHPDADQSPAPEVLQVSYGTGQPSWDMAEAPVLFGVTLAGQETFRRAALEAGTLRLSPNRLLLTAPVRAPKGTAHRASVIVDTLARHWLAQPWTPELRRAHEHHCAPRSLSRHAALVAEYEERMERLRRDRAYYIARADRASAVLQVGPVTAPLNAAPHPFPFASAETAGR